MSLNPGQIVSYVCDNQGTFTNILGYAFAVVPVASIASWFVERYNLLPPWAQRIVQLLAANVLHAALGNPAANPTPNALPPLPPL